jgi:hypothetical protein
MRPGVLPIRVSAKLRSPPRSHIPAARISGCWVARGPARGRFVAGSSHVQPSLHPVDQSPIVVRRHFPKRLLPPHRAHNDAQKAATNMLDRSLRWIQTPNKDGRYRTAKEQKPKHRLRKISIGKSGERVGERILSHGPDFRRRGGSFIGLKALASASSTVSVSVVPSASPFSKSPSARPIAFVTLARQSNALLRLRANV